VLHEIVRRLVFDEEDWDAGTIGTFDDLPPDLLKLLQHALAFEVRLTIQVLRAEVNMRFGRTNNQPVHGNLLIPVHSNHHPGIDVLGLDVYQSCRRIAADPLVDGFVFALVRFGALAVFVEVLDATRYGDDAQWNVDGGDTAG
jgi:hypothetical protein